MSQDRITIPIVLEGFGIQSGRLEPTVPFAKLLNSDDVEFKFVSLKVGPHGYIDPWQLRNDFLKWPTEQWSTFFQTVGDFGMNRISEKHFAEWQQLLRKALVLQPQDWKTLAAEFDPVKVDKLFEKLIISFEWDSRPPRARLRALRPLHAVIATIQVDKLQGAEFRICARTDCTNPPFRVELRKKIYCDSACAHLVAVRNSRKRTTAKEKPGMRESRKSTTRREK